MSEKRRGLGRGLGALIPSAPPQRSAAERPVDVFFPEKDRGSTGNTDQPDARAQDGASAEGAAPDGASPERTTSATAVTARAQSPEGTGGAPTTTSTAATGQQAAIDAASEAPTAGGSAEGASSADGAGAAGSGAANATAGSTGNIADGDDLLPVPGAEFAELPLALITPNPRQPRQVFDPEALDELVHSIREIGVLQPVVVRRITAPGSDTTTEQGEAPRYELVMGERRWRASQQAGLERIPAIIRDTQDDDLLRDALLENLHRSQLNPLEEAAAYQQLLDDFGCTHDELAQRIGRSRPMISNTLRLLRLPPIVQRRVAAGVLSAGHARALLGLGDAAAMERLAQRIVAEGLSVRSTEEIVALGGEQEKVATRRAARPGDRHAALDDLATRLSDRFDTRVKIALGQRRGKLTVEFASVEDLNRIVAVLAPEEKGVFRP